MYPADIHTPRPTGLPSDARHKADNVPLPINDASRHADDTPRADKGPRRDRLTEVHKPGGIALHQRSMPAKINDTPPLGEHTARPDKSEKHHPPAITESSKYPRLSRQCGNVPKANDDE